MNENYRWQGVPVKVRFGKVRVQQDKDKPLYWYNFEVLEMRTSYVPALEVTYQEPGSDRKQVFCISNHFGVGVDKLEAGGWPNKQHFSLPSDFLEYTAEEWSEYEDVPISFDPVGFANHEFKRDEWQKKMFPKEHEEREKFKEAFLKASQERSKRFSWK
ncbi:hypothetical protein FAZ19_16160 [Sphingobacterium alkalisoli]|uniref:Uncharacterized protein n=1 Tax=Sphingobacterium alkalisoli TaxID=1874115 RepID=A0A4U0GXA3_9SPHI|nr:hypothetical protein [Sphingobacterium alkalisoli]TJY63800.1 hypothetical protein FAZ19_16160 [Sphingobacterium alkalisoli]GGH24809.1 hypothetical protein GCM10011418_32980 [Sphingobacterium alkalisoli]